MPELDPRLLRIGVEVDGKIKLYDDLQIAVTGTKYANANQNECEVKITNIAKSTHDYLLSETSPFNLNRTPKKLLVYAGRISTGEAIVYEGDITNAVGSQPPDISVTLKAQTGNFQKGKIVGKNAAANSKLSSIAQGVAADLGLRLNFQATDKSIANYSHSGAALKQVDKLGTTGLVNAYINNGELVVKDLHVALKNRSRTLNIDTGMIGIPEFTEQGIKVKMLFDNQTDIGYGLIIKSIMNPAADGDYVVYKMSFELTNRDVPFYLVAEAMRRDGKVSAIAKNKKVKPIKTNK
jgi:hypothetical protein